MNDSPYNPVKDSRFEQLVEWLALLDIRYQQISTVATDAGSRRYYRLNVGNSTVIAVDADPQLEDTGAFINIAERLSNAGIKTPSIYHYSLENGFLLIEDLGSTQFQQQVETDRSDCEPLYQSAIDIITQMQKLATTDNLPRFDEHAIGIELSLFDEWYLKRHLGLSLSATQVAVIQKTYLQVTKSCTEQPQAFMHRDFHSRNLMLTTENQISVIDFQGAMLGPVTYDTGSLLKDAYTQPPADLSTSLCDYHRNNMEQPVSRDQYQRWYDLTALQRHLKILGIFCRLHYRDGKPQYLQHLPAVIAYIQQTTAAYPDLARFDDFMGSVVEGIA